MDVASWFLDTWPNLIKAVVVGVSSYLSIILMLRISGKRTLSKMNMFDWIITLGMGSVMATSLTDPSVPYARVIVSFATLICAQYVVTWLSVRFQAIDNLVKAPPSILYYQGKFLREEMKRERVPESEILSAMRQSGYGSPSDVDAVLFESNGKLVVMQKLTVSQANAVRPAENWEHVSELS